MIIHLIIILGCGAILWLGAGQVVAGAGRIARSLGMSELVVGLTVIAFGTSAPEFGVTIIAAIKGHGDISVANVTGSNIINLGFVLGGVALFGAIKTSRTLVRRDGIILIMVTILLIIFLWDGRLGHWKGLTFIILLLAYNIYLIRGEKPKRSAIESDRLKVLDIVRLVFGFIAIAVGGYYLVGSAVIIARAFGLSQWAIGQTIVAFGTSLPELATSLAAALKHRYGMSAGNLIGSNIFNILGVLGLSASIKSITISSASYFDLYFLLAFTILAVVLMRTDGSLNRIEGGILVAINILLWVLSFSGISV